MRRSHLVQAEVGSRRFLGPQHRHFVHRALADIGKNDQPLDRQLAFQRAEQFGRALEKSHQRIGLAATEIFWPQRHVLAEKVRLQRAFRQLLSRPRNLD
jgi:hypothetical protein